jgi:hypothetical protein
VKRRCPVCRPQYGSPWKPAITEHKETDPLAATLHEMLLAPDVKPQVVADCQALVERELDSKSGVSGIAIKIAYKAITAFAPGYYTETVESMLPDMADKLQPFWADFIASGGAGFGDYLAKRSDEVSEALLSVTDDMRDRSGRPTVIKAYNAVRNGAGKHIEAALPDLGAMVQKYG